MPQQGKGKGSKEGAASRRLGIGESVGKSPRGAGELSWYPVVHDEFPEMGNRQLVVSSFMPVLQQECGVCACARQLLHAKLARVPRPKSQELRQTLSAGSVPQAPHLPRQLSNTQGPPLVPAAAAHLTE